MNFAEDTFCSCMGTGATVSSKLRENDTEPPLGVVYVGATQVSLRGIHTRKTAGCFRQTPWIAQGQCKIECFG